MKLELENYQDYDGEWYVVKIQKDLMSPIDKQFFKVNNDGTNREEKLKEATDWYNRLKENYGKKEIILSEEI